MFHNNAGWSSRHGSFYQINFLLPKIKKNKYLNISTLKPAIIFIFIPIATRFMVIFFAVSQSQNPYLLYIQMFHVNNSI